jgi:hypothetical protein
MNNEQDDFSVKLLQIENEAKLALDDLPPGTLRNRIQFIATTARCSSTAWWSRLALSCRESQRVNPGASSG